jgi:hypothetical protein
MHGFHGSLRETARRHQCGGERKANDHHKTMMADVGGDPGPDMAPGGYRISSRGR